MSDRPHGEILVSRQGQILIARYIGMFNESGMQIGVVNMRAMIEQFDGQPFAMLVDDLEVEGGTPEAYQALELFNHWLNTQPMIAKAMLIDSMVKLKIVDALVASRKQQNLKNFTDKQAAMDWLEAQLAQAGKK